MEAKRKSEVVDVCSNSHISPNLQIACDYVAHKDRKKKGDTHDITPPKKKLRVASHHDRCKSSDGIILPVPANGHEYRKPEVAMILSAYTKGTKEISSAMNKMIDLKYVPCGIHTLRCLLASATNMSNQFLTQIGLPLEAAVLLLQVLMKSKLLPIAWKANLDVFGLIPTSHGLYLIITQKRLKLLVLYH